MIPLKTSSKWAELKHLVPLLLSGLRCQRLAKNSSPQTKSMNEKKESGEKSESPWMDSDVKFQEVEFAASEKPRRILITFKDDLGQTSTIENDFLPHAKFVMTTSMQIPNGATNRVISSSGLSRHDWGEESGLDNKTK